MDFYPKPYDRESYKEPSRALHALITQAREMLPKEKQNNIYEICRQLDELAYNKYQGKNYTNQLKRMGVLTTGDYLAKIQWYLVNER